MLADEIEAPAEVSPAELRAQYERRLAEVIETIGPAEAADRTGLDPEVIDAVAAGDAAGLDIEDAAAILGLPADGPDPEALLAEVRNRLLLGMSNAMLNVDVVANELDADVTPGEIQAMVEGRLSMDLEAYAQLRHYIETAAP